MEACYDLGGDVSSSRKLDGTDWTEMPVENIDDLGTEIAIASIKVTVDGLAKAYRTQAEYLYKKSIDLIVIGDSSGNDSSYYSGSQGNAVKARKADIEAVSKLCRLALKKFWVRIGEVEKSSKK